jgi:hypothetical protein
MSENTSFAATFRSEDEETPRYIAADVRDAGILFQVVIPKTGSTTLKYTSGLLWNELFRLKNSSFTESLPFLAGDCGNPLKDHMSKCVSMIPCVDEKQQEVGRCHFHNPSNHLSRTEISHGYLLERNIDLIKIPTHLIRFVTMLRQPVDRVASEFYQWKRGWCCGWFYSPELTSLRATIELKDFVQHRDCPANNRQTWMLADLPLLRGESERKFDVVTPSQFSRYFSQRYAGASNYSAALNDDTNLLRSAQHFVAAASMVGLTEAMGLSVAMLLFAVPQARDHLFERTTAEGGAEGGGAPAEAHGGLSKAGVVVQREERCWRLKAGLGPTGKREVHVRHDRASQYSLSAAVRADVARRNVLDEDLYRSAVEAHRKTAATFGLCADQPS